MERRFSNTIICFVTLVSQVSFHSICYAGSYLVYEVQAGDTLSSILYEHKALPVYGKKGSLIKTISINPFLYGQKGNYIVPRSKIKIPQQETDLQQYKKTERTISSISAEPVKTNQSDLKTPSTSVAEMEVMHPEKKFGSLISIKPHVSYSGLFATQISNGAKATLKSGLNFGTALEWNKNWNDGLGSYIKFDFNKVSFEKPTNRELLNSSLNLGSIAFGMNFIFEKWSLGLELSAEERVVLDALSLTEVQINKINSTNIAVMPGCKLFENDSGMLGLQGYLGYSASASNSNTTAKSGFNTVGGKLMFSQNLEQGRVVGGVFVKNYKLSTELVEESVLEEGLELWIEIPFGKSK